MTTCSLKIRQNISVNSPVSISSPKYTSIDSNESTGRQQETPTFHKSNVLRNKLMNLL